MDQIATLVEAPPGATRVHQAGEAVRQHRHRHADPAHERDGRRPEQALAPEAPHDRPDHRLEDPGEEAEREGEV
jgi:hypothetical protein